MSNFTDAKSFIVKAKKISKTRDVQILELLFDIKVNANGFCFQGWEITFIEILETKSKTGATDITR